ncbi:quinone oxidoreductase family protein [Oceanobacillus bengalensis]|uniref:Quinone oxidoreductase n=1 Tax=Oceanobacillus bengalensis TaxID=1435466 RepID=A0A494YWZ6_9BACI|nr:quinone oxidoreductase [Oceanobacillus bengalensis]RKQ14743.1 quinone oxidoreductase [Oceanobacillus bengalensis]
MKNVEAVVVEKFGGPEVLEYTTVDLTDVEPTEVLIKVEAISVNFADIKARRGNYHRASKSPFIPGLDCSGMIEAVGEEVEGLEVGQKVIAFPKNGSYASYVKADQLLTYPISPEVDSKIAAAYVTVAITSYNLLKKVARIQPGESVLIHGAAGGIGTIATQISKLLGATSVIGTVGSDEKLGIAKQAGADHVINYNKESFADFVNVLTGGKGVDVILDSYAGKMFEESIDCLAFFGRIVNFGNGIGGDGGKVDTNLLHSSCRSVLGYSTGTYRKFRPEELEEAAQQSIEFLENGKIQLFISREFTLQETAEAHRLMESRQTVGKIVLVP